MLTNRRNALYLYHIIVRMRNSLFIHLKKNNYYNNTRVWVIHQIFFPHSWKSTLIRLLYSYDDYGIKYNFQLNISWLAFCSKVVMFILALCVIWNDVSRLRWLDYSFMLLLKGKKIRKWCHTIEIFSVVKWAVKKHFK